MNSIKREVLRTWRHLPDALAAVLEEATTLGRLRVTAMQRLDMPLFECTGEELEKGLHEIVVAMGVAGVDWSEAARRILTAPSNPTSTTQAEGLTALFDPAERDVLPPDSLLAHRPDETAVAGP